MTRLLVLLAILAGVAFATTECGFILLFKKGLLAHVVPDPWLPFVRGLYRGQVEKVIPYDVVKVQSDAELGYSLRPGNFKVRDSEFETSYAINSKGFRDEQSSLESPEVVVVGDEIAMGVGVDQKDTIAKVIERNTGLRVLNAAIAGYGTARAMKVLDQIDTSHLKAVVIQYSKQQAAENFAFLKSGNLVVEDLEKERQKQIQRHNNQTYYTFGKFTLFLIGHLQKPIGFEAPARSGLPEIEAFMNAIQFGSRKSMQNVHMVAFELNRYHDGDPEFSSLVLKLQNNPLKSYPLSMREMKVLQFDTSLTEEHFYPLSGYLKKFGHEYIAEIVTPAIR